MIARTRLPHVALAAANGVWTAANGNKLGLLASLAQNLDAESMARSLVLVGPLAPAEALYIASTPPGRRPWPDAGTATIASLEAFRATYWALLPLIEAEEAATRAHVASKATAAPPDSGLTERTFSDRANGISDRNIF
jgi:hypothetical protein